jgi:hypothetical protein
MVKSIFSKHQRFLIATESSKYLLIFVLYVCVILCEFLLYLLILYYDYSVKTLTGIKFIIWTFAKNPEASKFLLLCVHNLVSEVCNHP